MGLVCLNIELCFQFQTSAEIEGNQYFWFPFIADFENTGIGDHKMCIDSNMLNSC